ncbi:hypothetical protein [Geothermobacter hydrogeniphilus]|uniref:Uncharacterized protein n=1 Tax=Geothermobacter hydrogeniphilus TaxID=1969733 RepID=A0A1X0Y5I4_9BACT|nr:hypothetical protein [Geothermobacter hydrogeniphilus]ORJ60304.1 hypothetical protein B5V00_08620 [Geothermobacter hydrogeniphilus]
MLKEYALDPECLKEWSTFRYLIENFGVSQGRLIAEFPRKWVKMAYAACGSFSFRQKQLAEIQLKRLKKAGLCKSNRPYDSGCKWLENAIRQQAHNPFHAIVSCISNIEAKVVDAHELTQAEPLWRTEKDRKILRTTKELGGAVSKLLQISDRILFVDKMFDPETDRWKELLLHFIGIASRGREIPPTFEYHTKIENEEYGKPEDVRTRDFQQVCQRELVDRLPDGCLIKIVRWDQRHGADFFHSRYILTEKGGLRIDWGLDVSRKAGETTDISLLDEDLWRGYWAWFARREGPLEFVDEVKVVR